MPLKSAQIQAEIDSKNAAINQEAANGQQTNHDQIIQWRDEIAALEVTKTAELAAEAQQQERVQAQAEKVDSIALAYDYNEILGNPLANETIIENVKQFQLQAYQEHNAEIARINAENKSNLDTLYARHEEVITQFKQDRDALQQRLDAETAQAQKDAAELTQLTQQVAQLGLEKQDAESKRDNAMRELADANITIESQRQAIAENANLKSQIEALQQELISKKAVSVNGNEKLAELAAKAKESTAAAAQRGIDRWNAQHGTTIPALEIPEIAPVNPVQEEAAATVAPFPEVQATHDTNVQADQGNTPVHEMVGATKTDSQKIGDIEVGNIAQLHHALFELAQSHEALKASSTALTARVDNIERHANIQAVA